MKHCPFLGGVPEGLHTSKVDFVCVWVYVSVCVLQNILLRVLHLIHGVVIFLPKNIHYFGHSHAKN